mmetsp:Transcript_1876/g.4542  ORF Transcript_1876/g.4542 Transcript_1876/m.4542 type:complete len:244 (-) Transcript_1876:402-1133(-)
MMPSRSWSMSGNVPANKSSNFLRNSAVAKGGAPTSQSSMASSGVETSWVRWWLRSAQNLGSSEASAKLARASASEVPVARNADSVHQEGRDMQCPAQGAPNTGTSTTRHATSRIGSCEIARAFRRTGRGPGQMWHGSSSLVRRRSPTGKPNARSDFVATSRVCSVSMHVSRRAENLAAGTQSPRRTCSNRARTACRPSSFTSNSAVTELGTSPAMVIFCQTSFSSSPDLGQQPIRQPWNCASS